MTIAGKLLEIFDKNPESAFEFNELHKRINENYNSTYSALQYLVRSKCVVKAYPGLGGGRNCTYFKRIRE
jgi:DNA-binding IclR family transcriptional regulator